MVPLIIIYFTVLILIGIFSAFQNKNSDDFYVAGKRCGLLYVTSSLLATILGSSAILGTISLSQHSGWSASWLMLCGSIGLLLLIPLAKYVRRYGKFTIADMLESFYGPQIKRIACTIIPIAWTGVIAAQIIGCGKIFAFLTPLSYMQGSILAGSVFTIYTILGGQISIVKTDQWQCVLIVFTLGLSAAAAIRLYGIPSWAHIHETFPFHHDFSWVDLLILLLTYASTFVVGPDIYSRLFCAKNERTATLSVFCAAVILAPVGFFLTFIGTTAALHSFDFLLAGPMPFILCLGLLSAVISSADTTLLTASATFAELFTDLGLMSSIKKTRLFIGLFGFLSTIIALVLPNIIQSLLLAFSFFSGAFLIPVIAGLLGLRAPTQRVLIAVLAGGILSLAGKLLDILAFGPGNLVIIAAFAVNALILFSKKNARPVTSS